MMRLWTACAVLLLFGGASAQEQPPTVDFDRAVLPILSNHCFFCHGPDPQKRKGDLRLDDEKEAKKSAIVPGKSAQSELIKRILATDADDLMPPPKANKKLSREQIEILRKWIDAGAPWGEHWSFRPLVKTPAPAGASHPVDAFIRARLAREKLAPSPEADRTTLLRRITLDLTGLPPTPEEADAFLADRTPQAYEKVVDRLLASPRYGERMAWRWLEAARYADTNGYQIDGDRDMWRWRDWVIEAYNRNLPFDQFTIEQLAGDLLPSPTLDQKIATGFNRNHRGNSEGGIIPEEYAVEYVVDRVDTTSTVWLGLSAGCAKCHDHKYDPLSQREFYQLYAYFNSIPERGKAIKY